MRFLVSGGGGFVGKALCKRLKSDGHEVVALARGKYPELAEIGVNTLRADISHDVEKLCDAFRGVEGVFHVASKVDVWGRWSDFYNTNVLGTRNVILACRRAGVKKLVYTSTPSVVADGKDRRGVNESYPVNFSNRAFYPATKALAEMEVLLANGVELKTIALRPHMIFGPGDTQLIPRILEKARAGKLKIIGHGNNLVDVCFIEDCVSAHIQAMRALDEMPSARGRAFFISQGQPVKLWDWLNAILIRSGLPAVTARIPQNLAYFIGAAMELIGKASGGLIVPPFTRFLFEEMSTDHYFDISAARQELNFIPRYNVQEALDLTFSS